MKDWIYKNVKRLFKAAALGFGVGFLIALAVSFFTDDDVNGILMLIFIIGSSVGFWYVLDNNNDFKK